MTWRALVLVLLSGFLLAALSAQPAAAQTVTVSGVITDSTTGAPIAGAKIDAFGAAGYLGAARTDEQGRFERQLAPGRYSVTAYASGYYAEAFGCRPADICGAGAAAEVTAGPNELNMAMVPATRPYVGAFGTLAWTHARGKPFTSMVLDIKYDAWAATPEGSPADLLVVEIADAAGRVLERADGDFDAAIGGQGGGGVGAFAVGSATGCSYFNSDARADLSQVTVRAYIASRPSEVVTTPVVPDRSQCMQTKLEISLLGRITSTSPPLRVDLVRRAPEVQGVAGTFIFTANKKTRKVRVGANGTSVRTNVAALLRSGRNSVKVAFAPSGAAFSAPPPRTVRLQVRAR